MGECHHEKESATAREPERNADVGLGTTEEARTSGAVMSGLDSGEWAQTKPVRRQPHQQQINHAPRPIQVSSYLCRIDACRAPLPKVEPASSSLVGLR